jgi:hypothetical protein
MELNGRVVLGVSLSDLKRINNLQGIIEDLSMLDIFGQ